MKQLSPIDMSGNKVQNLGSPSSSTDAATRGFIEAGFTTTGPIAVPTDAYSAGWSASAEVPTKGDVYSKIETIGGASYDYGMAYAISMNNLTL